MCILRLGASRALVSTRSGLHPVLARPQVTGMSTAEVLLRSFSATPISGHLALHQRRERNSKPLKMSPASSVLWMTPARTSGLSPVGLQVQSTRGSVHTPLLGVTEEWQKQLKEGDLPAKTTISEQLLEEMGIGKSETQSLQEALRLKRITTWGLLLDLKTKDKFIEACGNDELYGVAIWNYVQGYKTKAGRKFVEFGM